MAIGLLRFLFAPHSTMSAGARVLLCVLLFVAILPVPTVSAASGVWAVDADGNWGDASNWSSGIVAEGADATASFANNITGPRVVTLDSDRTIGNMAFSDSVSSSASAWILSGSKTLTLYVTGGVPAITSTFQTTINTFLAGNEGFTKLGSRPLKLTAGNSFGGTTTVSRGILDAVDGVGLPASTNLNLNNSGSYEMSGVFKRSFDPAPERFNGRGRGALAQSAVRWRSNSTVVPALSLGEVAVSFPMGRISFLEGQVDFQNSIDLAGGESSDQSRCKWYW